MRISLEEAIAIMGINPKAATNSLCSGTFPGAICTGGAWSFDKEKVEATTRFFDRMADEIIKAAVGMSRY